MCEGPFRPTENGTLIMNDFAWNKLANMVFIEQPAGVGFSTIEGTGFKYGDEQAAQDNYQFVKGWLLSNIFNNATTTLRVILR
jgi:carboxypeptidase C (cathepsin A)